MILIKGNNKLIHTYTLLDDILAENPMKRVIIHMKVHWSAIDKFLETRVHLPIESSHFSSIRASKIVRIGICPPYILSNKTNPSSPALT